MKTNMKKAFDPIRSDPDLNERTRNAVASAAVRQGKPALRKRLSRGLSAAVAFVMLVALFSVGYIALNDTSVAAISVDINPSIELEVNAFKRVVSVQAYNEEGQGLLAGLDLVGTPARQAIHSIVAAAAAAGYVEADGSSIIAITTSADLGKLKAQLEQATAEAAQEALDETGEEAVVYHDAIGLERVEAARALGITPGRLNLIEKLIALDPTKTVEQYLDAKASDIMKEVVALQQAEQVAGKETNSSEKTADADTKASEKAAAAEARASEKAARMADAVGKSKANQAKNNPGQSKKSTGSTTSATTVVQPTTAASTSGS